MINQHPITRSPIEAILAIQREYPLEWWYAHGRLIDSRGERHDFMAALFRNAFDDGAGKESTMLVLSHVEHSRGVHKTLCRVSKDYAKSFDCFVHRAATAFLPKFIAWALVRAYKLAARAHGVTLSRQSANFSLNSFVVEWDDFRLAAEDESIALTFCIDGDRRFVLRLAPAAAWSDLHGSAPEMGSFSGYRSCPRLHAAGELNGTRVQGSAWFDHEWGETTQLILTQGGRPRFVGWDWFAINLEDGEDLMLWRRRDMPECHPRDAYALHFSRSGGRLLPNSFSVQESGFTRGAHSLTRFPTSWTIDVPDLDISLAFSPEHDFGEIPIYGPVASIWEGPGTVNGTRGDGPLSGMGWLELHGYGLVLDPLPLFRYSSEVVEAAIHRLLANFSPR